MPLADALSLLRSRSTSSRGGAKRRRPAGTAGCGDVRLTLVEAPQSTGHMPAFEGQLSDDEITAVAEFVAGR